MMMINGIETHLAVAADEQLALARVDPEAGERVYLDLLYSPRDVNGHFKVWETRPHHLRSRQHPEKMIRFMY
jgi:hypothetical protein